MTRRKWARALAGLLLGGLIAGGQCGVEPTPGDNDASDDLGWVASATVYVVDSPAAENEFREIPEAMAYLCARLTGDDLGEVVIRTERPLLVETLTFDCAVAIRAEDGAAPTIAGPGLVPVTVNASSGLGLVGLTITNAAGVAINTAGDDLILQDNTLPEGVTLNIGAITSNAKSLRLRKDAGTKTWKILSNRLGPGVNLNLNSDLGADSKCSVSKNEGHTCTLAGKGSVAGELTYSGNIFNVISIDTKLRASAALSLTDHQALDSLAMNLQESDTPEVTLSHNVTASAKISVLGQASAKLTLTSNQFDDAEVKFGVSDLEIKALGTTYGRLAMLATAALASPILHYSEVDSKILGTFSFTALEAGTEDAKVTVTFNNVDAQSNFEVDVKCQAKFTLSGDTVIRGSAGIKVDGNIYELEEAKVRWDAGLYLEAQGVNAGLKVTSKAATYKDHFSAFTQPTATLTIEITDAIFQGASVGIGKSGAPQGNQKSIRTAQAADDSIVLRNVQWSESGLAAAIMDVDGRVTIENCQMSTSLQAMSLARIAGPVTVTGNAFQFLMGMTFQDCEQVVTIDGNTFAQMGNGGPDVWLVGSRGLIQNNVMPNGLLVTQPGAYGRVTANQIGGNISISAGGLLSLQNNTLTGANVSDDLFSTGGLVNNPVTDNIGLSPEDTQSLIDFNGNGCADYPPTYDTRDGDGKCYTDGVAVPADPGL